MKNSGNKRMIQSMKKAYGERLMELHILQLMELPEKAKREYGQAEGIFRTMFTILCQDEAKLDKEQYMV